MKTNTSKSLVARILSAVKRKLSGNRKENPEVVRLKRKNSRIQKYVTSLPSLSDLEKRIVDGLEKHGTFITSLEELGKNGIDYTGLLKAADKVMPTIAFSETNNIYNFIACANEADFQENPIIPLWGLQPSFLRIATSYIGMPVAYRGLLFRKDIPNKVADETRMWHVDGEDDKIMKIIVYLNDVTIDDGPYEYISKSDKTKQEVAARFSGRVSDENMKTLVPESKWNSCTGKRSTVVFTDPCSIYHRGKVPVSDVARYTLFYAYNSVLPSNPVNAKGIFSENLRQFLVTNNNGLNTEPLENAYKYGDWK
jgi:hypothetical protein